MSGFGKGVVTKTSMDSCDVSICIDGTTRVLSFGPGEFMGSLICDDPDLPDPDMDDVLEEGMEVTVQWVMSQSNVPDIIAVWPGDSPPRRRSSDEYSDTSSEDGSPRAIYDQVGCVIAVNADGFVVRTDDYEVGVRKGVVFRDGCRLDDDATLDIDEEVTLDAIACESADLSGPPYQATCAWIGVQPCLMDRFEVDFKPNEDRSFVLNAEMDILRTHEVYGTVVVIPNEEVALVEVEFESAIFKVILLRNSFKTACERIQDMVKVDDGLCMRLEYGYIVSGCQQWLAVKAVKDDEGSLRSDGGSSSSLLEQEIETENIAAGGSRSDGGSSCSLLEQETETDNIAAGGSGSDGGSSRCLLEQETETENIAAGSSRSDVGSSSSLLEQETETENIEAGGAVSSDDDEVLYSEPPLSGTISKLSYDSAVIRYKRWKIFVHRDNFCIDYRFDITGFMLFFSHSHNKTVNFEAIPTKRMNFTHEATCAWVGHKPSLNVVSSTLRPPKLALAEESWQFFYGYVAKLCLPREALVVIPGESTTVSIRVNDIQGKPKYKPEARDNLITNFVRLNDCVKFKIIRCRKALSGCDVCVTPFSAETWMNANAGVFVSRDPYVEPVTYSSKAVEAIMKKVAAESFDEYFKLLRARSVALGAPRLPDAYDRAAFQSPRKSKYFVKRDFGSKAAYRGEMPKKTSASSVNKSESLANNRYTGEAAKKYTAGKYTGYNSAAFPQIQQQYFGRPRTFFIKPRAPKNGGEPKPEPPRKAKAPGNRQTPKIPASTNEVAAETAAAKIIAAGNAGQSCPSKKAAAKHSNLRSAEKKTASENSTSENAAARNSAARNADMQRVGISKAASKNAAAKNRKAPKASIQQAGGGIVAPGKATPKTSGAQSASNNPASRSAAFENASAQNSAAQKSSIQPADISSNASAKSAAAKKAAAKRRAAKKQKSADAPVLLSYSAFSNA